MTLPAIVAALSAAVSGKVAMLSVTLKSASAGHAAVKIREIRWNFGEGATIITGKDVKSQSHEYATHGSYPVSVVVKDFHDRTATASATVVIEAPVIEPPIDPPVDPPPPPPPPPPPDPVTVALPAIEPTRFLSPSGAYKNVAAHGSRVLLCQGDGSVATALSEDEGATIPPFAGRGSGASFLEHPIAILGDRAVLVTAAKNVSFDLFGTRQAGDLSIRTSLDGAKTFSAAKQFTVGRCAFRLGTVLDPNNPDYAAVAYMTRRIVGSSSTWDIEFTESFNAFAATPTWAPIEVLFEGVQWVGGHRPSLALSNGIMHLICFGERIGKPAVLIEGNRTLNPGTEVFHAKRVDGAWQGGFITNTSIYCGRPEMVLAGDSSIVVFDVRAQTPGADNDIGCVISRDGGDTYSDIIYLRQGVGESTHPVLARHRSGLIACVWNETANGVSHNFARFTTDLGATWTPTMQISEVESGTPTIAFSENYLHIVASRRSGGQMTYQRMGAFT
jgi:PKD repeat protein